MNRKMRSRVYNIVVILIMLIISVLFLMPYVGMILNSFKHKTEIMKGRTFWPQKFIIDNYITVYEGAPIVQWFWNSLFVSVVGTVLVLITSSLCGFVFGKYEFKGKQAMFLFVLATMMIPSSVTMIPSFLLIDGLGMYDNLLSLIIPGMVGGFGIFLCKQFIEDIPTALIEAAYIDGASDMYIYANIVIPLIKPAIGALTIFTFLGKWNDYVGPLLYLSDPKRMTMPLALSYFTGQRANDFGAVMAAAVLISLPVTIVYLCLQKQFVKGIAITGMK